MIQFKVLGPMDSAGKLAVHDTEFQTLESKLAVRFTEIIVSGSDYAKHLGDHLHEESSQKKLLPVEQICKRACDLASYLMIEMRKREWIVEGPQVDEVYKSGE